MYQVRIHGRGGQGVVTAAELLAVAAFDSGRHAQAFPTFGSERTGAPVTAFCRVADAPIRVREPVAVPDALVVQDATLLHLPEVFAGLPPHGDVVVNSPLDPGDLALPGGAGLAGGCRTGRLLTVPATDIALAHLGRPKPNVALLGALAAVTGVVSLAALLQAVRERMRPDLAEANAAAAEEAFHLVRDPIREGGSGAPSARGLAGRR